MTTRPAATRVPRPRITTTMMTVALDRAAATTRRDAFFAALFDACELAIRAPHDTAAADHTVAA